MQQSEPKRKAFHAAQIERQEVSVKNIFKQTQFIAMQREEARRHASSDGSDYDEDYQDFDYEFDEDEIEDYLEVPQSLKRKPNQRSDPSKRPRGRPRKMQQQQDLNTTTPKRPRGRPRKTPLVAVEKIEEYEPYSEDEQIPLVQPKVKIQKTLNPHGALRDCLGNNFNFEKRLCIGRGFKDTVITEAIEVDVTVDDRHVSQQHCSLIYDDWTRRCSLINHSKNGTYVNGMVVFAEPYELRSDDQIVLNSYNPSTTFIFKKIN
jgi:hypothetical protein